MALTSLPVQPLDEPAALRADEREVGGKAHGLARLADLADRIGEGVAVPAFRVLPASAFRAHLERPDVSEHLGQALLQLADIELDSPDTAARAEICSRELVQAVTSVELAREVVAALGQALDELAPGPWSVRSSMVGEDSAAHSFAGQLDTFLFLPDADAVIDATRRAWASAFSPRALVYELRAGLSPAAARMAVVVQRMVAAEASGVLFSANPLNGARDEVLITAAWGQGEGVVSGLCDTDEYVYRSGAGEHRATVADKDVQVVADPDGLGTTQSPVPASARRTCALSPEQVGQLGRLATKVASALGAPQDIEFCYEGGRAYALQTRPITALPEAPNVDGPTVIWDNSNIQESYCGVTTPLTFSFASRAYATVYRTFFGVVGTPDRVLRANRDLFPNLLGLLDGRVYYNLNNWYDGCLLFPSSRHTKDDMENMMGVQEPVDFVVDEEPSARIRLTRTAALAPVVARLIPQLLTIDERIAKFQRHFRLVVDSVDRTALTTQSFSELMGVIRRLDRELMERWDVPILNDLRVLRSSGGLRRFVAAALGADASEEEVVRTCSDLLGGIEGIASIEPTRMLLRMASVARATPRVADLLRVGRPAEVLTALRDEEPTFSARIDEYVNRYGDRVIGELKLETVSLREDPSFVNAVLRNYLERPDLDAESLTQRETAHYQAAFDVVAARLNRRQRRSFAGKVSACREAVKAREALRLDRTRLFGLYRDVYLAIGARLHEVGRLDTPRDVFWLTTDEIAAYDAGRSVTKNLAALAGLRASEFDRFGRAELPHRIQTVGPVYHGNSLARAEPPPEVMGAEVLTGTGCYPGVIESAVAVVSSPDDDLSVNGRILVTVRTDPGWAPLFPTCTGLLVERGSTLSHSAVVARELGIPAIIGIRELTRVLRDGEVVRMDGAEGTVHRLADAT